MSIDNLAKSELVKIESLLIGWEDKRRDWSEGEAIGRKLW